VRLFLRLTTEVNDRLRTMMRCHGELSRYIDEALTAADLEAVQLLSRDSGRGRGITAVISHSANDRLRCAAKQRGCTVRALANSPSRNGSEGNMPRSTDVTTRIRIIGLAGSFVAVAAIGLTLVTVRGLSGAVGSGTHSERIFPLAVAGVLCVVDLALVCAHRAKARSTDRNSET
jgi:hypothetical protein